MSCVICLTNPSIITLHPCNHTPLCPTCTPLLTSPLCPLCRTKVTTLHIPQDNSIIHLSNLQALRTARDEDTRSSTAQILLTAASHTASCANSLLSRLISLFPAPSTPHTTLAGLPYTSPFAPNALVKNTPTNFSFFLTPPTPTETAVSAIRQARPDLLLIATPLHDRNALPEMLSWDASLRASIASLPARMWLFLDRSTDTPWKSGTNLYFKEDVYQAFSTMPHCARPLTHHVLRPKGWFSSGIIRKIAVRSVFHASRTRSLTPLPDSNVFHFAVTPPTVPTNATYHV